MAPRRLSRRDWVLLPTIALLTVSVIAASIELIARALFPELDETKSCYSDNRLTGPRGIPDSVCRAKLPEGHMVEYRFNGHGDYTDNEGGAKAPGVFRIVMLGSSFAMGDGVPREESFAALLPNELWKHTGQKAEVYNEALPRRSARRFALQMGDTLALEPDMILWVFTYTDVRTASIMTASDDVLDYQTAAADGRNGTKNRDISIWKNLREKSRDAAVLLEHRINDQWRASRSFVLLTDAMAAVESQSQFLASNRTDETQYLDAVPSDQRIRHLKELDIYAGEILDRAKSAGVPVVAVLLPTRLQAAFLSNGSWPSSIDPYSLDNELRVIITKHGGTYVDILPYFRSIRNAERYYFPADGHPNSDGHALIADMLAKELTSVKIPGLAPGFSLAKTTNRDR